jgi:ABC-type Fe3+-hydroxamate transport system substrate-binding protein
MQSFTDQVGREVKLSHPPKRIVSLVPSLTSLICDLGLEVQLAGITSFCIHPEHVFKSKVRVGGTKNFKYERISELSPDLIVANKEENPKGPILKLAEKYPVWVSDVHDIDSALDMIQSLGAVLAAKERAHEVVSAIESGMNQLRVLHKGKESLSAIYLIWKDPYMAAGTDTFISSMMGSIGLSNALVSLGEGGLRYPRITLEQLKELNPDIVLLSTEPYPFKEKDAMELQQYLSKQCLLADGEAFSWYGSHTVKSIPYLKELASSLNDV